jgi:uncharacterized OB-fold protein
VSERPIRLGPVSRDEETAPFFDGSAVERLRLPRCGNGHWMDLTAWRCGRCGSTERTWADSAGRGTVVSWTVIHHRARADDPGPAVATVAIVELEEGPWLPVALVADGASLRTGMAVEVRFDHDGDETLPYFVPAGPAD